MTQERLQGLSLLCIESELARTVNYESVIAVIQSFAREKSRKAPIRMYNNWLQWSFKSLRVGGIFVKKCDG